MTDTTSYIDMLRKFGSDLGLPKLNVDELLQTQKKNIDALGQSAKVAAQGAQSVAQKQREVLEAGLREAATLARDYRALGKISREPCSPDRIRTESVRDRGPGSPGECVDRKAIDDGGGEDHPGSR